MSLASDTFTETPPAPAAPQPRPGVLDIAMYVPGRHTASAARTYRLSSNESPLGPSPAALDAYRQAAGRLEDYPDGSSLALREAIGAAHKLDAARIVCGNGSDELLHLLAACYAGPGDEVMFTAHGFLVYRIAALACGATPVVVDERNLTADVDALLAAVTERTRLVYLANPNNPTGTYLNRSEVARLHAGLPAHVLLVLDAAYAEYVEAADYEAGEALVAAHANVVMTRTFSKIHGLAALRVGWAYGPADVVDALNRVRGPFNVNAGAIAAGAAGVRDAAHVARARAHNARWRPWLEAEMARLGLTVTPSVGNFLLVHFSTLPGRTAAEADAFLVARGVLVRRVAAYGLPDALRVTVGSEEANRAFVSGLRDFLDQTR